MNTSIILDFVDDALHITHQKISRNIYEDLENLDPDGYDSIFSDTMVLVFGA
jgi:hypothetical protein